MLAHIHGGLRHKCETLLGGIQEVLSLEQVQHGWAGFVEVINSGNVVSATSQDEDLVGAIVVDVRDT